MRVPHPSFHSGFAMTCQQTKKASQRIIYGAGKQARACFDSLSTRSDALEKKTENRIVFGASKQTKPHTSASQSPSSIRTIPSAPEFHRVMCFSCASTRSARQKHSWAVPPIGNSLAQMCGRHPAPKVAIQLEKLYQPKIGCQNITRGG
jgi:hypothetical protein